MNVYRVDLLAWPLCMIRINISEMNLLSIGKNN